MDNNNATGMDFFNSLFAENEIIKKKAEAFDEVAKMFYEQNFGTATKAEIELKMFSIYIEAMLERYRSQDGVMNFNACSDYNIGKTLGIPQDKVKTLKVKKQARYPYRFEWRDSLLSIKDRIIYDEDKNKIIIPMPDPNLYNEIRNFIEEHDGYIEIQRGSNVMQMRPEYFFILLYSAIDDQEDKENIKKEFLKQLKEKNEDNSISDIHTDKELAEIALQKADNFFEMAKAIAEGVQNPLVGIIKAIQCISKTVRKS
ncbi:MAG: hypothetical protein IKP75_02360 [Oscillospiraceae bacterium]|nr:hypothetical protein [Oscillospiraceae bacterium]